MSGRRIFLAVLAVLLWSLVPTPASAQEARGLSPAARTLARCLETSDRLSVVMLIDESGSLRRTDPDDQRVDGVRAALTGLSRLADDDRSGKKTVEVLFLGFYGKVVPDPAVADGLRWQPVGEASVDALLRDTARIQQRDFGRDTDYATALAGARQALSARAGQLTRDGGAQPCKALVWFTDGDFSILDRSAAEAARSGLDTTLPYAPGVRLDRPGGGKRAVAAGRRYLCRPGGLMDDLVADGVVKFTIALSADIERPDQDFLQALTDGRGGGCGRDLSRDTGEYLDVDRSGELFFAFGDLFSGATPLGPEVGVCRERACPDGTTRFRLVEGMNRAIIRAETGARGVELRLGGPEGTSVSLRPGGPLDQSTSGARIRQRWVSNRAAEIDMELPDRAGWEGQWRLVFVDALGRTVNPQPQYAIQRFVDLDVVLLRDPQLVRGRNTGVAFRLERPSGGRTSPLLRRASASVAVIDPETTRSRPAAVQGPSRSGTFIAQVTAERTSRAAFAFLDVDVAFDLEDGFTVERVQRTFKIPSRPAAEEGYPVVTPEQLPLASIEGDATTSGTITVTASPDAGGCAYVGPPELRPPEEAGRVMTTFTPDARVPGSCVRLKAGERKTIRVTFDPERETVGSVPGVLPVRVTSDIAPGEQTTAVSFRFEMSPPVNVAKRLGIVAALTALGLLLPLLLLHGLNWLGARFSPKHRVRHRTFPVIVDADGLRAEDGSSLPVARSDLQLGSTATEPSERSLAIGRLDFKGVASGSWRDRRWQLLRGPYGVVSDADGRPIIAGILGGQQLRRMRKGRAHEVPLGLAGTWVFAVRQLVTSDAGWAATTPEPTGATGDLTIITADGGPQDQGAELLRAATQVLQGIDWQAEAEHFTAEEDEGGGLFGWRGRPKAPEPWATEDDTAAPPADEWLNAPDRGSAGSGGTGGHRF